MQDGHARMRLLKVLIATLIGIVIGASVGLFTLLAGLAVNPRVVAAWILVGAMAGFAKGAIPVLLETVVEWELNRRTPADEPEPRDLAVGDSEYPSQDPT